MNWYLIKKDINGLPYQRSQSFNQEPILEDGWDDVWSQTQWNEYMASLVVYSDQIPPNFECNSVGHFAHILNFIETNDYRKWRNALKDFVISLSSNEESGFQTLSDKDKEFCATHNIGSGEQRRLAIANDAQRDLSCFEYLMINEGAMVNSKNSGALKNVGGVWLKALCFSRLDHIEVIGYNGMTLPTFIFMQLQIQSQNPLEISGNVLDFYRTQGIDGMALGNPPLGISDFTECTQGTRYETTGLRTNATILNSINANQFGISGFNDINEFANELLYIIKIGKPSYL